MLGRGSPAVPVSRKDKGSNEQIILFHKRLVLVTALPLPGELKDVQDGAQEVFLRLYEYLHRFDDVRRFLPWLYRMTVNVCRDLNRQRRRSALVSFDELSQAEVEQLTRVLENNQSITS
jgi:RNA polymerase sigma-70 factor (ECF subfamily)